MCEIFVISGKESVMEEGLSSSLLKEKSQVHGAGSSGGESGSGSASATSAVVLSTFVAVCGSYVFGSAVSSTLLILQYPVTKFINIMYLMHELCISLM